MVNPAPIARVTDVIPREWLTQPFDENAFHHNVGQLVRYALPLCVGAVCALSLGILAVTFLLYWLATFFVGVGMSLGAFLFFIWQSYRDTRGDLNKRRQERQEIVIAVQQVISSITIQNVTVQRGASYNTYAPLGSELLSSQPLPAINETYDLALKIMRKGLEAWIANGGKRPKPKPISADAITGEFHVRREKWDEAMELLKTAGVFENPDSVYWRPNYVDYVTSKKALDDHLKRTYFLSTSGSGQVWLK